MNRGCGIIYGGRPVAGSDANLSFEVRRGRTTLNGGVKKLLHSKRATSIGGEESNYYLVLSSSIPMEQLKRLRK